MSKISIHYATENDAEELLGIYSWYVTDTAITFEYEVPSVEEFKNRIKNTLQKFPYLTAKNEAGEIVGYAYASPFKERAAYDWAVETSIYVKKELRGQGIGKKLLNALETILASQNILNVNACIACTENEDEYLTNASVKFHEKMGYKEVGVFHQCGYKFDQWYDMMWMEKMTGEHKKAQKAVNFWARTEEEAKEGLLKKVN